MKPNYKVTIGNGKYINQEYSCSLHIELHLWRFHWWYLVKKQRGNLFHIRNMADKWSHMLGYCRIIDKTIDG